ncbi:MAG: helix-turn-helix domain-containing protein [Lachnospiraceae bacterium]|nr:helix-turn-helix domain-containing protein [Lachnospiraceae bacterium]
MDIKLSENIRKFRKERRLTQEQLAEVLGVTTGAVHKWESGMSIPDISLIMEMADFFDTSVDVILGYKMKDNHIESALKRMAEMCRDSNPEALEEAEKLLKKYPNSFKVVHGCATIYSFFAVGNGKEAECKRALELYEQARLLIDQNADPCISEETLLGNMSMVYTLTGEYEKAVDVLKNHNPNGMFSDDIGLIMALNLNKTKESVPYLIDGIISGFGRILNSVLGYTAVLCSEKKYDIAKKMIVLAVDLMKGMYGGDEISFADKEYAMAYILLAYTYLKTGDREEAIALVKKTVYHTKKFDSEPNYNLGKFIFDIPEEMSMVSRDILGDSAEESMETMLKYINDPEMNELWEKYYNAELK